MTDTVSVSIVLFQPDFTMLRTTLSTLRTALQQARETGLLERASLDLVDNGTPDTPRLDAIAREEIAGHPWLSVKLIRGQGNLGYGRGHNLAILASSADYHLVLNPDVVVSSDAVVEAIRFLRANADVGLVAPDVRGPKGDRQYLCRLYPTVLVLFLRGFAPAAVRRRFQRYLDEHELRHLIRDSVVKGIPIASGCFMFARLDLLRAVGGFSPAYFLYFEDFDLSLRLSSKARLAFVPSVRIAHYGGNAAKKGVRHTMLFIRSAVTFFRTHGWRLA